MTVVLATQAEHQASEYAAFVKAVRASSDAQLTLIEASKPPGRYDDPPLNDFSIIQVVKGTGRVTCDYGAGRFSFSMSPGTLVVAPAGVSTSVVADSPFSIRFFATPWVRLSALLSNDAAGSVLDLGRVHASSFKSPFASAALEGLWGSACGDATLDRLFRDSTVTALLCNLLQASEQPVAPSRGGLAPWQLKRVCEAMADSLNTDIGLACLAGLIGVSPPHLCRAFKQSTGLPPFAWLLRCRIERAKELLCDPRISLADVALAIGFSAQPQFTTAFRRVTGMTPNVWRRERLR